jgi:hypothetical protein
MGIPGISMVIVICQRPSFMLGPPARRLPENRNKEIKNTRIIIFYSSLSLFV